MEPLHQYWQENCPSFSTKLEFGQFLRVRLAAHVSNGLKSCVLQAVISLPVKVWSR